MKRRDPEIVKAELEAVEARIAALRKKRETINARARAIDAELAQLAGGWGRGNRSAVLQAEWEDAGLPFVERGEHVYVVASLGPKQATVRAYGSGWGSSPWIIRASTAYPVVTLDECRAAWAAAGREVPK